MKRINKIEVKNSTFFGADFTINFSEKLSCIMGGRGTGKSTILYFIKSCLELDAEESKNTLSILKGNLGSGIISLYMQTENGAEYRIDKSFGEEPQPYFSPGDDLVPLDNIKKELACDIFPAQIIEEIGRNSEARLELIDRMALGEIADLKASIEAIQINLEKNAKDIRSQNQKLKRGIEILKEYASVEIELKKHKANKPPGISKKSEADFAKQDSAEKIRAAEKRFLKTLSDGLAQYLEKHSELAEEMKIITTQIDKAEKFTNKDIITPIIEKIQKVFNQIASNDAAAKKSLEVTIGDVGKVQTTLKVVHEQQHNKFIKLKQTLEKHKNYYDKLNILSKKISEKKIKLQENAELKEKREKLKVRRETSVKELNSLKQSIYNLRLAKINELNARFDGKIKITLTPGGITDAYEEALKNGLKGSNMRYNTIVPYIVKSFTPDKFAKVIHERNAKKLMEISSIDLDRSQAIIDALLETDVIYEIEGMYCQDLPDFHLKVDENDPESATRNKVSFKKSDELSTGQRCTTVLPIIFAISTNPLIIDQPEDNLDNKYISDTIHKIINEQKKGRQLIFITHNANIPVLSSSEQNVFLQYDNKQSSISAQGDVESVKNSILQLLEGGKEAFKTRKNLYGF